MPSNIPTTPERFAGIIEEMTDTKPYGGVIGQQEAAAACYDIYLATLEELFEDIDSLIPVTRKAQFLALKKEYTT